MSNWSPQELKKAERQDRAFREMLQQRMQQDQRVRRIYANRGIPFQIANPSASVYNEIQDIRETIGNIPLDYDVNSRVGGEINSLLEAQLNRLERLERAFTEHSTRAPLAFKRSSVIDIIKKITELKNQLKNAIREHKRARQQGFYAQLVRGRRSPTGGRPRGGYSQQKKQQSLRKKVGRTTAQQPSPITSAFGGAGGGYPPSRARHIPFGGGYSQQQRRGSTQSPKRKSGRSTAQQSFRNSARQGLARAGIQRVGAGGGAGAGGGYPPSQTRVFSDVKSSFTKLLQDIEKMRRTAPGELEKRTRQISQRFDTIVRQARTLPQNNQVQDFIQTAQLSKIDFLIGLYDDNRST